MAAAPAPLQSPTRNRYFYGKLLDELHLRMEQDYLNGKRWMLNRLGLGAGVLCGLRLTADNGMICVSPGVAIDALGREIVVPGRACLDPWVIARDCASGSKTLPRDQRQVVHIALCYQECGRDFEPAMVSDCGSSQPCEASTTVEGFCLVVREGDAPPLPPHDETLCEAIGKGTPDEKAAQLCAALDGAPCAEPAADPCVVLGAIVLEADGTIGRVAGCAGRTQIYSNEMLFKLLLCAQGGGQGKDGKDGKDGIDGKDGKDGVDGKDGLNGKDGVDGKDGKDGKDGAGLIPDLTKITDVSWPHDKPMPIAAFMKGLRARFSAAVTPVTPHGRAWFLVRVEFPQAAEGTILEVLVLDTSIGMESGNTVAAFTPAAAFEATFINLMAKLDLKEALVRVTLKCASLVDAKKRPADGEFLGANLPTGDGLPGADFEGWFFLTR